MGVIWEVRSNREVTIILSGDNYFGGGGDQVSKSHMRAQVKKLIFGSMTRQS